MEISLVGAVAALLAIVAPFLVSAYLQRLPVAPACPTCRAVTREADGLWGLTRMIGLLPTTRVSECGRCGWRGCMRWRWAPRAARSDR